MAKTKRPEIKNMYDITTLLIILYFLKEMVKVWVPTWKQGIFLLEVGCFCCIGILFAILLYIYVYFDSNARKLREMFYYYGLEGMNGYPKYRGKKEADYSWLYRKEFNESIDYENDVNDSGVIVSPFDESKTLQDFYNNNTHLMRYRYTLPTGLCVSDIGKKLEGIVQHLERDVLILYNDGGFEVVVGDRLEHRFIQKLKE